MRLRWVVGACVVGLCVASSAALGADQLTEGFDDVATLAGAGWVQTNNSNPLGETNWFQGNAGIFVAQAGGDDSYIAANYLNAGDGGNVSNWLLTPLLAVDPTVELKFFTRTEVASLFPDRLEVRLSTLGASSDVGATDTSVGDFSTLLLSINPSLDIGGYPTEWTEFTVSLSGAVVGPVSGRLAFRYFVNNTAENGNYIGIDTVRVTAVPEPGAGLLLLTGSAGWLLAVARRRKRHGALSRRR